MEEVTLDDVKKICKFGLFDEILKKYNINVENIDEDLLQKGIDLGIKVFTEQKGSVTNSIDFLLNELLLKIRSEEKVVECNIEKCLQCFECPVCFGKKHEFKECLNKHKTCIKCTKEIKKHCFKFICPLCRSSFK
jgi:hypothetical protein